jgi:hypothetical protein
MAQASKIEWTQATLNPWTGCTKVDPACAHCYIEHTPPFRMAGREFVRGHIALVFHMDRLDAMVRSPVLPSPGARTMSPLMVARQAALNKAKGGK